MDLRNRIIMDAPHLETASGSTISINTGVAAPLKSCTATYAVTQSGSGDPSLDNVRPITARTSLECGFSGKNMLYNHIVSPYTSAGVVFTRNADGSVTAVRSETGSAHGYRQIPLELPPGNYYFTVGSLPTNTDAFVWDTDSVTGRAKKWDGVTSCDSAVEEKLYEFKVFEGHSYVLRMRVYDIYVGTVTFYPMICAATETDPRYEPFGGHLSVELSSTYGDGEIDILNGTGVCRYAVKSTDIHLTSSGSISSIGTVGSYTRFWIYLSGARKAGTTCICDKLPHNTSQGYSNYTTAALRIGASDSYLNSYWMLMPTSLVGTTASTIYDYLHNVNPIQICYELGTEATFTFAPVRYKVHRGINTIQAEDGEIEIEYWTH